MNFRKSVAFMMAMGMLSASMVGCSSGDSGSSSSGSSSSGESASSSTSTDASTETSTDVSVETPAVAEGFQLIDADTVGEIDIMLWSGDGVYHQDIGKQDWAPEDITAGNVAAVYAMAKDFKEEYPNIKINLYAKIGGPDENDVMWAQELENFRAERGKYPDIYASTDLSGDVTRGLVADLSIYADDPLYQSFNPAIMQMILHIETHSEYGELQKPKKSFPSFRFHLLFQ